MLSPCGVVKMADRKIKQTLGLAALIIGVVAFTGVLGYALWPRGQYQGPSVLDTPVSESVLRTRTEAATAENIWVNTGEAKLELLRQEIEELRGLRKGDAQTLERVVQRSTQAVEDLKADYDEALRQQLEKIASLEAALAAETRKPSGAGASDVFAPQTDAPKLHAQIEQLPNGDFITPTAVNRGQSAAGSRGQVSEGRENASPRAPSEQGFGVEFTLAKASLDSEEGELAHISGYVPAGSYMPAVVMSGVDAGAGVRSQSDPLPVLFKVTGALRTAAVPGGQPASADLRGCRVQGSATGDLSSERVIVRLVSLSCIFENGRVLERELTGYMSGAGKNGVRGKVTSREGGLVTNAMIAGTLGGLGQSVGSAGTSATLQDSASMEQLLRGAGTSAVGNGFGTAAQSLAEYYIERAEQYQPVISLYAGTKVELVLTKGVRIR